MITSVTPNRKVESLILIVLTLWSAGWRIAYHLQTRDSIVMEVFSLDDLWYDSRARELLDGEWPEDKSFERGPFYPYFLAGIYALFGHEPDIVRILQHLAGVLQILLIYNLIRKLVPLWIAAFIGLIAGMYGAFIMHEGEILIESTTLLFVTIALFLITPFDTGKRPRHCLAAGIFLGLAALGRPNLLPLVFLIAPWLLLNRIHPLFKSRLRNTASFLLGTACVIAPVTLRNLVVADEFVLISSHGGINFYIGNNPAADGFTANSPMKIQYGDHYEDNILLAARRIAESAERRPLTDGEVSRFWYEESYLYIYDHPVEWLKLITRKLILTFNTFENANFRDMQFFAEHYSPILRITLLLTNIILPLGTIGLILGWRDRRNLGALYLSVLATIIVLLMFFVTSRYRLMMIPAFMVFSGITLQKAAAWIRSGRTHSLVILMLVTAGLLWFGNLNWAGIRTPHPEASLNAIGKLYIRKGDLEQAEKLISEALQINPDLDDPYYNAWVNLGRIRFHLGKFEASLIAYEEAAKRTPGDPVLQNELRIARNKVNLAGESESVVRE